MNHEDRRELRGSYLMAAWTNHFDSREQNTLDMWIAPDKGKPGYIQHHIIDFGDCFGSIWEPPMMGRRIGKSHYMALDHVFVDWISLGTGQAPLGRDALLQDQAGARLLPGGGLRAGRLSARLPPTPAMLRMTERATAPGWRASWRA